MMSGFGKAQNAMNSRAVPGGDPVIVKSDTVALGMKIYSFIYLYKC